MMTPTATHIAYYHLCHRKLWLVCNGIRMENNTDNTYVEMGKLISDATGLASFLESSAVSSSAIAAADEPRSTSETIKSVAFMTVPVRIIRV